MWWEATWWWYNIAHTLICIKLSIFSSLIFAKWKWRVLISIIVTVRALLTETLISRQLYARTCTNTKFCFSQLPYKLFILIFPLAASSGPVTDTFFVSQWCLLTRTSIVQVVVKGWIFERGKPESFTHHDGPLLGNWFYPAKLWHTLLQELLHLWAKFPVHFHQARSAVQFLDLLFLSLCKKKRFSSYMNMDVDLMVI